MKIIKLNIFALLFMCTLFCTNTFAQSSSADALTEDFITYQQKIDPDVVKYLTEIDKYSKQTTDIIEKKAKGNIDSLKKNMNTLYSKLVKHMNDSTKLLKTAEIKRYHEISTKFVQTRQKITNDFIDEFKKAGELTAESEKKIASKYEKELNSLGEENAKILTNIQKVLNPDGNKNVVNPHGSANPHTAPNDTKK